MASVISNQHRFARERAGARRWTRALAALTLVALAGPVGATHLVDHRFTIVGEVHYDDGTPAVNEVVEMLVAKDERAAEYKTNERGRYRITLHVHDEDHGKVLNLRVRDKTRKVKLKFNPRDNKTERGKRIDFVIPRPLSVEEN